jgi:hypothetical protein
VAASRGLVGRLAELEPAVAEAAAARSDRNRRVVDVARRIHRWRQEIIHGSGDGQGHR